MRAVIQCVNEASVTVDNTTLASIGKGALVLLGIGHGDTAETAQKLWNKIYKLRMFDDAEGKTNLSLGDIQGDVLIVSQFTLYASCKKGNRPSFTDAAKPDQAHELYEYFVSLARADVKNVDIGKFGAMMEVSLTNHGPFTLVLDTNEL